MKVKFTNLYNLIQEKNKIISKINHLIKNSRFVGGKDLLEFEKNFSKFTKSKYCIGVGNGTDALEMAVKSLQLPKNSEIIVPNNTWISTAEAVTNNGYKVVFCDVNLNDYSICTNDLKKKINNNTAAIIPVHLYGNPANMTDIKKIIYKKKIKIIEDCAQAHGTKILKKHVGTFW
jgi:Predicted pyridoxal phosphate-dependent enzyme apparently involved in regulation of cell wall biogenesis